MRLRLLTVALAALVVAGCGKSTHGELADYLNRVHDVETGLAGPLQQVTSVNQAFAKSRKDAQQSRELATSERTLRTLRKRLANVTPPPEARHLRALLLQLVDSEVSLAHEVRQLADFVPRYRVALAPLQPASTALQKKLSAGAKGVAATKAVNASKAAQLESYASTVGAVLGGLQGLDPPPVWRPTYEQQLTSLRGLRSSALALASAVRANHAQAIPALLEQFDKAAISNQTIAAQKREIAAVKAYNARIDKLLKLGRKVENERRRLERQYR